jgi:hypothetical protein
MELIPFSSSKWVLLLITSHLSSQSRFFSSIAVICHSYWMHAEDHRPSSCSTLLPKITRNHVWSWGLVSLPIEMSETSSRLMSTTKSWVKVVLCHKNSTIYYYYNLLVCSTSLHLFVLIALQHHFTSFYLYTLYTVKLRKRRVMTSSFDIRRPLYHYHHAACCCIS